MLKLLPGGSLYTVIEPSSPGTADQVLKVASVLGTVLTLGWATLSSGAGIEAATTTGTAPAYVLTPTTPLASYVAGNRYQVTFHAASTTYNATIAVSGLAAKSIKKYNAQGTKVFTTIPANLRSDIIYDGTDFVLQTPAPSPVTRTDAAHALNEFRAKVSPQDSGWYGPTWCAALRLWIMISTGGTSRAAYSATGAVWTLVAGAPASTGVWASAAWSPLHSIAVAVGVGCAMSTTTGTAWVSRTPANSNTSNAVIWAGGTRNRFVSVAIDGVANRAQYSTDGQTWVAGDTTGADKLWYDVAYSPELDRLAAISNTGGTNDIMTSDDGGATWALRTTPNVAAGTWLSICWANALGLFVGVGVNGAVMTSPDGITWTAQTGIGTSNTYNHVRWAEETGALLAVSHIGTNNQMSWSPDAINWYLCYNGTTNQTRRCGWSPERGAWLLTCDSGTGNRVHCNF